MSLLEVSRLSVAFQRYGGLLRREEIPCLHDVSLTVDRGEVLGLFGSSGAGKSLLAHAVLDLLPPNAIVCGSVHFGGTQLSRGNISGFRGRRITLVPQSISHLDPLARVGQQMQWAASRAGRKPSTEELKTTLLRFNLSETLLNAFPHTLSGGMARRVMLAIASLADSDLVIADEPTNGLDEDNTISVLSHLRGFADAGKAVVAISHDLAATAKVADRVTILRDGSVAGQEAAGGFTGNGNGLSSPYARALWRALPQNGFSSEIADVA